MCQRCLTAASHTNAVSTPPISILPKFLIREFFRERAPCKATGESRHTKRQMLVATYSDVYAKNCLSPVEFSSSLPYFHLGGHFRLPLHFTFTAFPRNYFEDRTFMKEDILHDTAFANCIFEFLRLLKTSNFSKKGTQIL